MSISIEQVDRTTLQKVIEFYNSFGEEKKAGINLINKKDGSITEGGVSIGGLDGSIWLTSGIDSKLGNKFTIGCSRFEKIRPFLSAEFLSKQSAESIDRMSNLISSYFLEYQSPKGSHLSSVEINNSLENSIQNITLRAYESDGYKSSVITLTTAHTNVGRSEIRLSSRDFIIDVQNNRMFKITNQEVQARGTIATQITSDFAEYFETDNEPPILAGFSVIIKDNGKIRPAKIGENPIGVISANPAILGNSADEWPYKYLKDDFGNKIIEEVEEEVNVNNSLGYEVMNSEYQGEKRMVKVMKPRLNPDYDPNREYIPRRERPEWHIVGLLGQIPLRKGQPVAPTWVKIKDISENVELWLVK